jgi:hypothetical protein
MDGILPLISLRRDWKGQFILLVCLFIVFRSTDIQPGAVEGDDLHTLSLVECSLIRSVTIRAVASLSLQV